MSEIVPPSGTVTFLFTDIEGSTRLWEQSPEQMAVALARHDQLMRQAIVEAGGYVFKTMGDAFCAAFGSAISGAEAAITAQLALLREPWPEGVVIRVRMALHTGSVESRDGDYFGQAVNRVARVLTAGHGGQTLVTQATYQLIRDNLDKAWGILEMGEHRLKDLARAESIYQILHPDLPSEFGQLRSLDSPELPNNLPQQLTSFIGREGVIVEIENLLEKTRLLTLTGSGGCGKTRLTIQVAAELLDQFPDGAWLVELAPLNDRDLVPQAVANVLGLREQPGREILETLVEHLRQKRLLLILDNCEHLLDASAKLADRIIRQCPLVVIMASSREPLGITGEQAFRVSSLSMPNPKQITTAAELLQFEAVRLFVDRATLARPDFAVTVANCPVIASICHRLDGIPLAIELAAARTRSLSIEEIDQRLDQRFKLLTGGSRTALPRQQTLRSLIDWSYDLLNSCERLLLVRLSAFSGGWNLEAAEQVCSGDDVEEWEVLDLLTSLADKSLVVVEEAHGMSRYRQLETVRQYARERLTESAQVESLRDRHFDYFMKLAEEAEPELIGANQAEWLNRLEMEHDNLRSALEWTQHQPAGDLRGLRLAGALSRFWKFRGYMAEGRTWTAAFLVRSADDSARALRVKVLNGAAILALDQSDFRAATELAEESLKICRDIGDVAGTGTALNALGHASVKLGERDKARLLYEESLQIWREKGDLVRMSMVLNNIGMVTCELGDYGAAHDYYEESLSISRRRGHAYGEALGLGNLGALAALQGDYAAARLLLEQALDGARTLGNQTLTASFLFAEALMSLHRPDLDQAKNLAIEGLELYRALGDPMGIASCLLVYGSACLDAGELRSAIVAVSEALSIAEEQDDLTLRIDALDASAPLVARLGEYEVAVSVWGAANRLREEDGTPIPLNQRPRHERLLEDVRSRIPTSQFTEAWEMGIEMSNLSALSVARDALQKSPTPTINSEANTPAQIVSESHRVALGF